MRGSSLHTEVATLQGEGVRCTQRWPRFRGLDEREFTAHRGGHASGGGSSLHTEVATLQGVG